MTPHYCEVRDRTEVLAGPLGPEDQVVQSMPDCSPTKWHRAHTTWFFEEFVLGPNVPGHRPVHDAYRFLFNSYYEAVGDRQPRPRRGMITRPTVDEVGDYRRRVDREMNELLDRPCTPEVAALVELGLHHEQQHQELLLMDAKHLLSQNPLRPAYAAERAPAPGAEPGPAGWLEHPGGVVEVGHGGGASGFAYDNESPRHEALLRPFAVADRLVTCGEWQEFVADDGYRRPDLWLSDGWAAIAEHGWSAPLYWEDVDGDPHVFTLTGRRPLDPAEPVVHVSYYEADAFARWRGVRLPSEAEWEVAARAHGRPADPGSAGPGPRHPGAVHPRPVGAAADRLQFHGEAWQWTASAYLPYPGFEPAAGAVGEYNGKFMVNQHVLRGSCCATPPGHARHTYRNFFPPGARWMFGGVRLATDV